MKKILSAVILLLLTLRVSGQVVIDFGMIEQTQNVRMKCFVQESKTGDPIRFATVYLVPERDTVITNFAIANDEGEVDISDIVPGRYEVNIEMLGYIPYKKVHDLRGWEKNLGVIKMDENPEYIDAATITAMGNPIIVKKDTLEYNAAAFKVGENAMLEDLLKKMPGMEVASDGTVKVNGEKVDKITVGGKTFFFEDPAMAVKNLPAKIVDKIKVIDKEKDAAAFSGVSTKDEKEKVMDVELKDEYKAGWFGNANLSGGATLVPAEDRQLSGAPGALFSGTALVSGYNEKDQLTLLGSGKNVLSDGGMIFIASDFDSDADELSWKSGMTTSAQAGANYNTGRIKGFDYNASVSYNYSKKDARENTARTSFQSQGPDINKEGTFKGLGKDHKVITSMELEKSDTKKYMIDIRPSFTFTSRDRDISNSSSTSSGGVWQNSSVSNKQSHSNIFSTTTYWDLGIKDMGKERRNLTFSGSYHFQGSNGNSTELSTMEYKDSPSSVDADNRNLRYDSDARRHAAEGVLSYVEPIGKNWSVQARMTGCLILLNSNKDAFNGIDGSANDYYSAFTKNDDYLLRERLLMQYKKDDATVVFGVQLDQEQNVTNSRSLGRESTVGKDEWKFNWAPYADVRWSKNDLNIGFQYGGQSDSPSSSDLIPTIDISDPVQITAGNIYLRPQFSHYGFFTVRHNNRKKFSYINLTLNANINTNPRVTASWFDDTGVRYSIPVNSRRSGWSTSVFTSFTAPLDKEKHISLEGYAQVRYNSNTSYQAKSRLVGFDKDNFDYTQMMAQFWGGPDGERFYGGQSGFAESSTNAFTWNIQPRLKFNYNRFTAVLEGFVNNNTTKYSLNKEANMNKWDFSIGPDLLYRTEKGWEFTTDLSYSFYKGYTDGFNDPELIWNFGISKAIKSVTLSLKAHDILNQTKTRNRTTSAEYVEDTYHNVMGRYFLFGVAFNFGKMSAKQNQAAQNAMWNMMF